MSRDRRVHPRQALALRVDYVDPKGGINLGLTGDLSRGGMFLKHSPGLSMHDIITVMFELPTRGMCKLQAEVVRSVRHGSGLCFVGRKKWAAASLQELEAYFDEVLPTEVQPEEVWPEDVLI